MRKTPYTELGIKRMKCFRCGEKAYSQWQVCSDDNQWRPLCWECDVRLNELVLRFMEFKDWEKKIFKYLNKK